MSFQATVASSNDSVCYSSDGAEYETSNSETVISISLLVYAVSV